MNFVIGVPVLNQPQTTQKWLDLIKKNTPSDVPVIIVDNGSTSPVRDWLIGLSGDDLVIRNDQNVGVTKSLNQIWHVAQKQFKADYVIYLHNDVYIYADNWIETIKQAFNEAGDVGVAGFFGAYGMASSDIYRAPYDFRQLARQLPVSGLKCRVNHGQLRLSPPRWWDKVAVLDGFSLITKVEMLEKVGGFDEVTYPIHHMYDLDLCLSSIKAGYTNIVIDLDCDHHGGITDVGEDWATPFGTTREQVHQGVHPPFYEKWRDMLPYRV
jgi:GT2 family glycosyltransferase